MENSDEKPMGGEGGNGARAVHRPDRGEGAVGIGQESRLYLAGDSTLHAFSSTATHITAAVTVVDASTADLKASLLSGKVSGLELTIPVKALKSGEKGLDKNMYAALKSDLSPVITFTMSRYEVNESSGAQSVTAFGQLAIAGEKKEVPIAAALSWRDGRAVLDGARELLMTDFGIKPPAMMLGAIKTKNRIVVGFHLELEKTPDGSKTAAP